MIALLSYSTNSLANDCDTIPSTGGQDSTLISYDDLRKVNSKIIELKYEKEINKELRNIITNDSIAIDGLNKRIQQDRKDYDTQIQQITNQRNVACGLGIVSVILLVLSLL